jgi:DNA invertase Pin-like site-specific DNA recombinase
MTKQVKRAALYVRVSTGHQTLENQIHELTQIAERRGWQVVEIYKDHGISGAKDQIKRTGHFVTKHDEVKKRLGRPNADPDKLRKASAELAKGIGINKVAKAVGLGVGTVLRLKDEMRNAEIVTAA